MVSLPLRARVEQVFATVETMNLDAVLALFAQDAVLYDPHYPRPHMAGKGQIAEGVRWGFGAM